MIIVVLPAYNEAACIVGLVEGIASTLKGLGDKYRIIVVNDGSSDDTEKLVADLSSDLPIVLVNHANNMGLGATIRDGLKKAAGLAADEDTIITMDADDTHDPAYFAALIEKINEGKDVVIASRFAEGGGERGLSSIRKFLSRGAGLLLRIFFPIPGVRDYTCGYRAYSAETIKKAFTAHGTDFVTEPGFASTAEILLKLHQMGADIGEVPFVLKYDLKQGKSKIRISKTIVAYLKMMVRLRRGKAIKEMIYLF